MRMGVGYLHAKSYGKMKLVTIYRKSIQFKFSDGSHFAIMSANSIKLGDNNSKNPT